MILVTTAGKVGAEAARLVAATGESVRLLVHSPERAAAFVDVVAQGGQVVVGDLARPETLGPAMKGVTSVVLVSPAIPDQELAVVDAAQRAGVGHIVKITSKASADSPIQRRRNQTRIEEGVLASGIPSTFLRNNAYMQNFLMLAPMIAATGSFSASAGEGRVGMIDTADVAAVAAAIALAPDRHAGKTYWPTGPASLSYADAAQIISDVAGRPVAYVPITVDQQRDAMLALGLPSRVAEDNARALGLFAEGDADYVTRDVPTLLGRPARSFADFVTTHAAAFAPRTQPPTRK